MKRWLGPREFYARVLKISIPIVLQQLFLTTFGIVDTIMVGSLFRGVAGVGIASQFEQIILTVVFGINVGIGLYLAQFFGAEDEENMKRTFALGIMYCLGFTVLATLVVAFFRVPLIQIFNQDPAVVSQASNYLMIALFAYIPNAISFLFSIAYRNIQRTKVPLVISVFTMSMNVLLNYLLIFGIGPFPELGVQGAAIATVISTVVSLICHVMYARVSHQVFLPKLRHFLECIHPDFLHKVSRKMAPFIINELFFSIGGALYVIFINTLGSDAYEGYRIAETVVGIMFVFAFGVATSVGAMLGQELGRKRLETASRYADYFLFIGLIVALFLAALNFGLARPLVSLFQNNTPQVVENAIRVLWVFSLRLLLRVFVVLMFAAFRAGGQGRFVMFLDAGLMWLIGIPMAFLAANVLHIQDIALFFLIMQIEPAVRLVIGMRRYWKRTWIRNLTDEIRKGSSTTTPAS